MGRGCDIRFSSSAGLSEGDTVCMGIESHLEVLHTSQPDPRIMSLAFRNTPMRYHALGFVLGLRALSISDRQIG